MNKETFTLEDIKKASKISMDFLIDNFERFALMRFGIVDVWAYLPSCGVRGSKRFERAVSRMVHTELYYIWNVDTTINTDDTDHSDNV